MAYHAISFLTNYIYFPWAKSLKNVNFLNTMIITFLVFVVAGFWHGPSWLYVIFGSLHGLGLVINHTFRRFFNYRMSSLLACFLTFNYVNFTFVFFRSKNIEDALNILRGMFGANGYGYPDFSNFSVYIILILLLSVIITFVSKNTNYLIENFNSFNLESKISK